MASRQVAFTLQVVMRPLSFFRRRIAVGNIGVTGSMLRIQTARRKLDEIVVYLRNERSAKVQEDCIHGLI